MNRVFYVDGLEVVIMKNYKGFYKVAEDNGGVCVGTFWNPETKESFSKITWDIDRPYINDDEEIEILRYLPINREVRSAWLHYNGIIQVNDVVEVVKGRKVPIGTIAKVIDKKPYKDRYGRTQAIYLYFDNGMKTNENNCGLCR